MEEIKNKEAVQEIITHVWTTNQNCVFILVGTIIAYL